MKSIPKNQLDELIRLTKKYYKTGDTDILAARSNASNSISESACGNTYSALSFDNIVCAMLGGFGLKKDATYQDVYDVFALIGYEVVDNSEKATA